eukprot:symbB.v1.2.031598.t1/scaffold3686.1/size52022/3
MPTGVLVRWNSEKGFGFIQPQDNSEDVFCHVSDLQDGEGSVMEGDHVLYTEKWDNRKGKYRAAEVELSAPGEQAEISAIQKRKKAARDARRERGGDRSRSRGHRDDDRGAKPKPQSNEPGKEGGSGPGDKGRDRDRHRRSKSRSRNRKERSHSSRRRRRSRSSSG